MASGCLRNTYLYTHRLGPHQQSCAMDLVNIKAETGQSAENKMSVKYSGMNGTSTHTHTLTSRFRKHQKRWWKDFKRYKQERLGPRYLLNMVGELHSGTAMVVCTVSSQSTLHHEVGRDTQAPTPSWGATDIWWLLVYICSGLVWGVVPDSFPMPHWTTPTYAYMDTTNSTE